MAKSHVRGEAMRIPHGEVSHRGRRRSDGEVSSNARYGMPRRTRGEGSLGKVTILSEVAIVGKDAILGEP